MPLFDDDDDSLSSSSSSSSPARPQAQNPSPVGQQGRSVKAPSSDEASAFLHMLNAKKRSAFDDSAKPNSTSASTVRVGASSHFRHTAGGGPALAAPSSAKAPTGEKSVFGNSIAAALQLRKETQQELVWQRLERERAAEQHDASLIEKDLEVAPFVTPAYQHAIRQRRLQQQKGSAQEGGPPKGQEEEDDDPLEKYLQTLMEETEQAHAHTATLAPADHTAHGDYYERQLHATLTKEKEDRRQKEVTQTAEDPSDTLVTDVPPVSMEELQQLVRAPSAAAPNTAAPALSVEHAEQEQENSAAAALEAHNKALFVAREARKRRRADGVFVESCAARCNERMYKCFRVF